MDPPEQPDWRRLLTDWERARMLDDIARVSLVVGTDLFPGRPWQDMGVSSDSLEASRSPIERLAWMEHLPASLTLALAQISRDPLADAMKGTRPTPPARARRVGTPALLQAVRRGHAARWLPETVSTLSHDTPENRALKAFLLMLRRDCLAIEVLAEEEGKTEAEARAARCAEALRGLLSGWWEAVSEEPAAWTRAPSARAMARPEYACVFREMQRARLGFAFDWANPLMTLPPRETWRLYEAWCLFQTLDALRALGWRPTAGADARPNDLFAVRAGRLTLSLATGLPSHVALHGPHGRRLAVAYNEMFGEGQRSLSHTMQPDITLALGERLWVLDAKFKPYALPGEEGDDINQMHAYRDAICDSAGNRNVARAWLLYTGRAEGQNRSRIAYGMAADPAVGALCLRPGDDASLTRLTTLLGQWLGEETETEAKPATPQT